MLGKLIKYEFKATARLFLPMFGALIAVSLINRLFDLLGMTTPWGISVAISVIIMIGIIVAALIITIQRFYKNVLQSEGYLTLTLPVKTESIIVSKLIVSTVWYIASFIVVLFSILLIASVDIDFRVIPRAFELLFTSPLGTAARGVLLIFEVVAALIFSLFSATLLMYACLALGMLANSRRILFSFVAFLVISTAVQILGSIVTGLAYVTGIWQLFENMSTFALTQLALLLVIGIELVGSAIFFLLTRYMLARRLNLQ